MGRNYHRKSFFLTQVWYLRWLGRTLSSKEGTGSINGCSLCEGRIGVAFVAHSTVDSMIWSRLKSSDSNSNSLSDSYSISLSCSLVNSRLSSLQTTHHPNLEVIFPGGKHSPLLSYLQKLDALIHSYNWCLHLQWLGRVVLEWQVSELWDCVRVASLEQ